MRFFVFIILFLSISCNQPEKIVFHPSKIDSLTTKEQVEAFIQKSDTNYRKYVLKEIQNFHRGFKTDKITQKIARKLQIDSAYYKTDFDRNGYTDLLAIGTGTYSDVSFEPIVLMNFGNDSLQILRIEKIIFRSMVPEIVMDKKHTFLVTHHPGDIDWQTKKYKDEQIDTLIYKFGSFVEYNPHPAQHDIKLIEYEAGHCYGYCPVFTLSITKDEAYFLADAFNFSRDMSYLLEKDEGYFKTKIKPEDYKKITALLNYLNFKNLKDNYAVNSTDMQNCRLRIVYDDNKQKWIRDYGLSGTYGLKRLYQLLFDLRFNQDWEEVKDDSEK